MQSTTRASVYFICRNALNKRFSQRLHNLSVSRSHAIILWAYCFAWQRIYCNNILAAKYYRFKFACEWKRKNELIWINSQPQKSIWISFFANGFFFALPMDRLLLPVPVSVHLKISFRLMKKQATAYWIVWFRWRDANAKYQKSMMRDNKNIHTLIHSERRSSMGGEEEHTNTHTRFEWARLKIVHKFTWFICVALFLFARCIAFFMQPKWMLPVRERALLWCRARKKLKTKWEWEKKWCSREHINTLLHRCRRRPTSN